MFLSLAHRSKFVLARKVVSVIMTFAFLTSLSAPAGAQLASLLPVPGSAVTISPVFVPATLKGLNIHPENPFLFDFIVGRGDDKIQGPALKAESEKLVKFFLTAMTIPDKEAWVNLSPYEANRIIPDALGKTEMGKVMLEQDYLLKQLASSLTNPDTDLGKKFWTDVRAKAKEKFGTTDIPMSTFNKVWIVPSKAEVAEKDGKVFITKNSLKVMLEEDYDAMQRNISWTADAIQKNNVGNGRDRSVQELSSLVFRSTILPTIEKEINEGKNFAAVRQIYDAAILAVWYKSALKESLLGKIYADKSKVKGIETDAVGFKEEVYKKYVEAFKKGAYNMIKEDFDMSKDEATPRRYFSGGMSTAYPDGVAVSSGVTDVVVKSDDVVVRVLNAEEKPEADVLAKSAASESLKELNNAQLVDAIKNAQVGVGTHFEKITTLENGRYSTFWSRTIDKIIFDSFGQPQRIIFDNISIPIKLINEVIVSSSSVEDNLDKYVMDLRAENSSYEQMYKTFESRYNTNRRLLQDVANNFLFTKDEKTGAPMAVDYKQAYQMALGQLSETDKLFLLFFEDVSKRVSALKAESQSEEQAINVVLEKEVQRIQNVQKIEQERLAQIAQRKQQLRDEISQLLPSIIQKLSTEVQNATARLSTAANQSQRDAAIRSEIQRQYDALKAGVEQRVRKINYGKDLATMHILPGQALRRAISELSLQDQILYQLFPEVQKQMENMTRSDPSANDKFDRALKAAKEATIQKTIAASSPLPIEEQAKQNLAKKLGFSLEDTPSVQEVEQRYKDIAQGRYKTGDPENDAKIRTNMKLFDSIEMQEGEFYEMLVGQEIDEIYQSPEMLAILDKVARELEAARSISPDVSGSTQVGGEKSASSQVGGINFDPTLMNLQVKRDKNGVPLPVFQQDLPNINIEGLYPVIINIAPATMANFPLLSKAEEQKQRIPSAKDDLSPLDRQKVARRQGV